MQLNGGQADVGDIDVRQVTIFCLQAPPHHTILEDLGQVETDFSENENGCAFPLHQPISGQRQLKVIRSAPCTSGCSSPRLHLQAKELERRADNLASYQIC